MSEPKNPQAFPQPWHPDMGYSPSGGEGMTLRDYFAAAALQGYLSNPSNSGGDFEEFAADAWAQADAMLEEREKTR